MTVVRINAISVPEGAGDELENRFRHRLGAVDQQPGFLGFELLRPTGENERRWFVVTRWESAEAFEAWVNSPAFGHGHGQPSGGGHGGGERPPVATGSEVLAFDVVLSSTPAKTS